MSFFKNILNKLKGIPKSLKNFSFKNIIRYFKTHRLMGIIYLIAIAATIVIVVLVALSMRDAEGEIEAKGEEQSQVKTDIKDLSITIPENAFPYTKKFRIEELARNAAYDTFKQLGNFYGNIYELTPVDGRTDLALEPMTYEYMIPGEFYFGKEYNNAELIYIEDKENPVVRIFSGAEMIKNDKSQPVLRVKGFHGSLIGLRISNPVKPDLGMKEIIEKEDTLKPDVILIPGIDSNFKGFLPNTLSNSNPQGNNLWEVTFPNRSIWVYQYPLTETRTMDYVDEAKTFFDKISLTSYVRFEAEKLAEKLISMNKSYDIIAHGMGGIIARYAVENYPVTNVRKMVLISVPNSGSNTVNPSFLNLIYGKDPEILSKIYGLTSDTIRYLERNNLSYLEKINVFYTDILPYSETINSLQNTIRDDIEYFFVAGNKPDFNADLENSQFAKFYPENTLGKGDGIVSVYSAIYPTVDETTQEKKNIISKIFPFSFFDIFLQQQTLQYIYAFLEEGIEVVEIPEFKDDTFKEWLFNSDATSTGEKIKLPELDPSTSTENTDNATSVDQTESNVINKDFNNDINTDLEKWRNQFFNNVDSTDTTTTESSSNTVKNPTTNTDAVNKSADTSNQKNSPDIFQTVKNVEDSQINKIENVLSIIEDLNKDANNTENISTSTQTSIDLRTYTPTSASWNTNIFPKSFANINNMVVYDYSQYKLPDNMTPYGMITINDSIYMFDNSGIIYFKNGTFSRISDSQTVAYTTYSGGLYTVNDNILSKYVNGDPVQMEYLMFEAPIISIGVNDSVRYYLLNHNGLTLETPKSSYRLDGHYGEVIMYGMYPYIITDVAVYLFDGKECREIYRPYNSDIQLLTGKIFNDSLYLLASDYSLRALSLDGKKELILTSNNTGGFKILKKTDQLVVVGKNKFNILNYTFKSPEGTYFDIPEGEKIVDADLFAGNLMVLTRDTEHLFLKKVAILE